MGYKLSSTVIREVQAKTAAHPDGWPSSLLLALIVAANEANATTGELRLSAPQLAELAGLHERTIRSGLDRAIGEGMCWRRKPHTVAVIFPDPNRIYPGHTPGSSDSDPGRESTDPGHTPGKSGSHTRHHGDGMSRDARKRASPKHQRNANDLPAGLRKRDAEAEAELARNRPRTDAELELIAERKRQRDADDAAWTAAQDAELELDAIPTFPPTTTRTE